MWLADVLIERHARGLLDDAAEDVGVVAVDVALAGLRFEGQRAEPFHGRADGFVLVGEVPAETGRGPEALGLVQRGELRLLAVVDARGVREQVADGDRAASRPRWSCDAVLARA